MVDADRWIEQVREDSLSRLEAVQQMQRELDGLVGRASSPDGRVRLEVQPTGALTRLDLSHAALGLSPEQLSAEILATAAEATAEVGVRMRQIVGGVVGEDELEAFLTGNVPDSSRREVEDEIRAWREGDL